MAKALKLPVVIELELILCVLAVGIIIRFRWEAAGYRYSLRHIRHSAILDTCQKLRSSLSLPPLSWSAFQGH
jgi:hypothetical protein